MGRCQRKHKRPSQAGEGFLDLVDLEAASFEITLYQWSNRLLFSSLSEGRIIDRNQRSVKSKSFLRDKGLVQTSKFR
jgi:hypothetical protein